METLGCWAVGEMPARLAPISGRAAVSSCLAGVSEDVLSHWGVCSRGKQGAVASFFSSNHMA